MLQSSICVANEICSVGIKASLIEDPGALSFVKSSALVTNPFIPIGIKVASPQLVTWRPSVTSTKLPFIVSNPVEIYASNN